MGEYVVAFLLKTLFLTKQGFLFYKIGSYVGAPIAIWGRRLSFKNPHHLFDGDFLFYQIGSYLGPPIAIGGRRLSFKNSHHLFDGDFLFYYTFGFLPQST